MKPIKWTKADAKRAEKMGFELRVPGAFNHPSDYRIFSTFGGPIKNNYYARQWVLRRMRFFGVEPSDQDYKTMKKAILLCMGGNS